MANKRGQVTIFIIIAILVVAMVVLFFMFRGKVGERAPAVPEVVNPNSFLKSCVSGVVEETLRVLPMQGGYMKNPLSIKFKFGTEPYWDISYLCYTSTNDLCVVQQPSIVNHMEQELKDELSKDLEDYCFKDLADSYREKGYTVDEKYNDFEVDLVEDKLMIKLDAELTLMKDGDTSREKDFEIEFPTKLYNLGKVAQTIIESETKVGTFDEIAYVLNSPEYKITYYTSGLTKIYTVEFREFREKFRFAVKGSS